MATISRHSDKLRLLVDHPRSGSQMLALASWCGVEEDQARAAVSHIRAGRVTGLLVSGPQGSGKDSVCPAVLAASGISGAVQCRVAHGIRAEMSDIISTIAASNTPDLAANEVAQRFDVPLYAAEVYVESFFEETRDAMHHVNVHERTERMRRALQLHGSDARAHQPGYWVKKACRAMFENLASGLSVYMTDGRYPGEIDGARVLGIYCVRLHVPEQVRIDRIMARDGFSPSLETLRHPNETAGNGYWGLDAEVDNTHDMDSTVELVTELFTIHRERMLHIN